MDVIEEVKVFVKIQKKIFFFLGGGRVRPGGGGDVGYGGCKQRIKGIDKCKERFCTILRIIKIIKKGVSVGAGG